MRIHNIYFYDEGGTHFRRIDIEWDSEGAFSKPSAILPAKWVIFFQEFGDLDPD